jgi:lysophospholipase L1-like esterase
VSPNNTYRRNCQTFSIAADILLRAVIQQQRILNRHYSTLVDGKKVVFLDMGSQFLEPDGTFPERLSADATHLKAEGYEIWARAMLPTLTKMLARPD